MTWLFYWEFWMSSGMVLLILESMEGSFNYFLPLSLGSFFTGAIVFLFPELTWKWILFALAFCSVASFMGLKLVLKKKDDKDINDY